MAEILYFAYGSNLNIPQMIHRCPNSICVSPAVLNGWQLRERTYADIEPAEGKCVHGALYEISEDDLASLDSYEGYPEFYDRIIVSVIDHDGCHREALVYTMTERYKNIRSNRPFSERYRKVCSDGAESWGIPNAFVRKDHNEIK